MASLLFNTAEAQLNMDCDGDVGIGLSLDPTYKLDVQSSYVRFDHSSTYNDPLLFKLQVSDPRICSDNQIIFYETDQSGYIDIKVKTCIESSDSTLKTDIREIASGISVVSQLNGVTYFYKNEEISPRRPGLIAQEVEKVLPGIVYTADSTGIKSISYTKIIPYLVEAVKEQQDMIENLQSEVQALSNNSNMKSASITTNTDESLEITEGVLKQNSPNPFHESTEIFFSLSGSTQHAVINVYNMSGTQLKSIELFQRGEGSIMINGGEFNPGMYMYAMIADGRIISTKQMILTD